MFDGSDGSPVPVAFVAVTVKVYGVPLLKPWTVHSVAVVVVHVWPPGKLVAVYPLITPPVTIGATQVRFAERLPACAATAVGGPGTVSGVTVLDGSEAGPVPATLVAVTVNAYGVPLVRPETVQKVAPVLAQVWLSVVLVTV
jgi:hypothetical protein